MVLQKAAQETAQNRGQQKGKKRNGNCQGQLFALQGSKIHRADIKNSVRRTVNYASATPYIAIHTVRAQNVGKHGDCPAPRKWFYK